MAKVKVKYKDKVYEYEKKQITVHLPDSFVDSVNKYVDMKNRDKKRIKKYTKTELVYYALKDFMDKGK